MPEAVLLFHNINSCLPQEKTKYFIVTEYNLLGGEGVQTVYIDLYFMINLSMDFLALFICARLLSYKFSLLRAVVAAGLGGAYACTSLILSLGGIFGFLLDIVACIAICFVALKKQGNIKETLFFSLTFTATSILLGGFMTVLFSFFNKIGLNRFFSAGGDNTDDGGAVWLFALFAGISAVISLVGGKMFLRRSSRRSCTVEVTLLGKTATLRAICDSGNLLREPISGKACIVADSKKLAIILPKEFLNFGIFGGEDMCGGSTELGRRIRAVPSRSVGGESLLCAFRPDKIQIKIGGTVREADTYIAISHEGFADSEEFDALVPSELIA